MTAKASASAGTSAAAANKRAARKARAIELAAAFVPYRAIADELGCTRQTVHNYVKAYLADLPPLGFITRHRLHVAMSEANGLDALLRIASVARHYPDVPENGDGDGGDFLMPDITTVPGRMDAVRAIAQAVADGALTPSKATAMLACVKEASDIDGLAEEIETVREMERYVEHYTNGAYKARNPNPGDYWPAAAGQC